MEKDIFCKIAQGGIPAYKVWEDEDFLAFLSIKPKSAGHTLVIPKKHYRWVWDVPNFGEYLEKVREVKQKLQKALQPEFVEMWAFGLDVPHAHIHLIPHYQKEPTRRELPQIAQEINAVNS